jgi:RND superfamily putative drug exporter
MFHALGRIVSRAWLLLLAAWVLLLIFSRIAAPPWGDVAQDKEFAFLPADAPSRRSEEVFARAFPEDKLASSIVLVLQDSNSEAGHLDRDLKFIDDDLEPGIYQIAQAEGGLVGEEPASEEPLFSDESQPAPPPKPRSIIAHIRTPNAPGSGALLVSPDGRGLLVVVELTTEFLSHANWPVIDNIQNLVATLRQQNKIPPGVDIVLTGSAVVGRDHTLAELQSAHATETLTVVLVIVLLVLIYRAPLLALIPLATVFLAVRATLNLLAVLAQAGHVTLFQGIQIYVTILSYGAGVDYCLFLMARYQEEFDQGGTPREALARAVGGVGAALVASAATVICGIGMMVFAEFGKFQEAGIAIPFGLFLVLLATLTFSAPLLALARRWAFWPQHPGRAASEPATVGRFRHWFFQPGEEPHRIWERIGRRLKRRPGTIWLTTVALMAPFVVVAGLLYNHLSYDLIGTLPADAPNVVGTRVLRAHFPAGLMGPVTVLLVNPHVDFTRPEGEALVRQITDRLRAQKEELGLADVRSLTAPLGITSAAQRGNAGLDVPQEARQEAMERAARARYVTDLGERAKIGTRLDLILEQSPFAHQSVADLDRVEQAVRTALPGPLQQDAQLYVVGVTASVRDLQAVMQRDRVRIELLVLAGVFLILVVLLRGLIVPLYLLVSVLFSYYTTLGVAFAFFWLLDPHGFTGIDWKVAIFLFTILIAVGEDYNIFLMSRIREEERQHGPERSILEALTRTGPIISSCGIIMAGTFASLLAGSLTEMKQLGFALAFGVLLDTFVVRPILVPTFLMLLQRHHLLPTG